MLQFHSTILRFLSILSLTASLNLYKGALAGVIHSPTSFFDTTPIGKRSLLVHLDVS